MGWLRRALGPTGLLAAPAAASIDLGSRSVEELMNVEVCTAARVT